MFKSSQPLVSALLLILMPLLGLATGPEEERTGSSSSQSLRLVGDAQTKPSVLELLSEDPADAEEEALSLHRLATEEELHQALVFLVGKGHTPTSWKNALLKIGATLPIAAASLEATSEIFVGDIRVLYVVQHLILRYQKPENALPIAMFVVGLEAAPTLSSVYTHVGELTNRFTYDRPHRQAKRWQRWVVNAGISGVAGLQSLKRLQVFYNAWLSDIGNPPLYGFWLTAPFFSFTTFMRNLKPVRLAAHDLWDKMSPGSWAAQKAREQLTGQLANSYRKVFDQRATSLADKLKLGRLLLEHLTVFQAAAQEEDPAERQQLESAAGLSLVSLLLNYDFSGDFHLRAENKDHPLGRQFMHEIGRWIAGAGTVGQWLIAYGTVQEFSESFDLSDSSTTALQILYPAIMTGASALTYTKAMPHVMTQFYDRLWGYDPNMHTTFVTYQPHSFGKTRAWVGFLDYIRNGIMATPEVLLGSHALYTMGISLFTNRLSVLLPVWLAQAGVDQYYDGDHTQALVTLIPRLTKCCTYGKDMEGDLDDIVRRLFAHFSDTVAKHLPDETVLTLRDLLEAQGAATREELEMKEMGTGEPQPWAKAEEAAYDPYDIEWNGSSSGSASPEGSPESEARTGTTRKTDSAPRTFAPGGMPLFDSSEEDRIGGASSSSASSSLPSSGRSRGSENTPLATPRHSPDSLRRPLLQEDYLAPSASFRPTEEGSSSSSSQTSPLSASPDEEDLEQARAAQPSRFRKLRSAVADRFGSLLTRSVQVYRTAKTKVDQTTRGIQKWSQEKLTHALRRLWTAW